MTEILDILVLKPMLFKGSFFLLAGLSITFAWFGVRNLYAESMKDAAGE